MIFRILVAASLLLLSNTAAAKPPSEARTVPVIGHDVAPLITGKDGTTSRFRMDDGDTLVCVEQGFRHECRSVRGKTRYVLGADGRAVQCSEDFLCWEPDNRLPALQSSEEGEAIPSRALQRPANLEAFDALGYVPELRRELRKFLPEAELTSLRSSFVDRKGLANLSKRSTVSYRFVDRTRAEHCAVEVELDQRGMRVAESRCDGVAFAMPRCSLAEALEHAFAQGLRRESSLLRIEYFLGSWRVSDGGLTLPVRDRCAPAEPKRLIGKPAPKPAVPRYLYGDRYQPTGQDGKQSLFLGILEDVLCEEEGSRLRCVSSKDRLPRARTSDGFDVCHSLRACWEKDGSIPVVSRGTKGRGSVPERDFALPRTSIDIVDYLAEARKLARRTFADAELYRMSIDIDAQGRQSGSYEFSSPAHSEECTVRLDVVRDLKGLRVRQSAQGCAQEIYQTPRCSFRDALARAVWIHGSSARWARKIEFSRGSWLFDERPVRDACD